jgi:hypothetical protein
MAVAYRLNMLQHALGDQEATPRMLMVANRMAAVTHQHAPVAAPGLPRACNMPPRMMIPLMALVTLIRGVCSAAADAPDHLPAHEAGQDEDGEVVEELLRARGRAGRSAWVTSA